MEAGVLGADMIGEGLRLMLIGMSIVFGFLMLLVVFLRGMSWLAARVAPAEPHDGAAAPIPAAVGGAAAADTELVAVMAAALARYRARQGG